MKRQKRRLPAGALVSVLVAVFAVVWPMGAEAANTAGQKPLPYGMFFAITWLATILVGDGAAAVALFGSWIYRPKKEEPEPPEPLYGVPGYANTALYYAPRSFDHPPERSAPLPAIAPLEPVYPCGKEARLSFVLGVTALLLPFTTVLPLVAAVLSIIVLTNAPNYLTKRTAAAALCMSVTAGVGGFIQLFFLI